MNRPAHRTRPVFARHVRATVIQPLLLIALLLPAGHGCGDAADRRHDDAGPVLILAAASTQDALQRLAAALEAQGGPTLTISPAGSNALAQQIIAGAPGDLFLSAHPTWAQEVATRGHAAQTVTLLSGQLVLVAPMDNAANVQQPPDLLREQVRRIALAGEHVPAGMYGRQALQARGLLDSLATSGRIIHGQNVRLTLAYVERGEADAGIVYASDAAAANVRVVFTFDPADHEPILYPLVLLKRGSERPAARQAFEFLQSADAAAIFAQHGFRPLTDEAAIAR